jgi:hypothetical protein
MAVIGSLYKEVGGLSLLSEALNFDFKTKGMDEAYSEEELEGMSGMQAMYNRVTDVIGRNPTMRDFLNIAHCARARGQWWAAPRTSPTNSNNGSLSAPATDSSSRRPTFPAHLRISSAW